MPPKEGMAIGNMMSAPLPVEVKIGKRAKMVVAVVIMAGLTRLNPPWTTASRIPAMVLGSVWL